MQLKNYQKALQDYNHAIDRDADKVTYFHRGEIYRKLRKYNDMIIICILLNKVYGLVALNII